MSSSLTKMRTKRRTSPLRLEQALAQPRVPRAERLDERADRFGLERELGGSPDERAQRGRDLDLDGHRLFLLVRPLPLAARAISCGPS